MSGLKHFFNRILLTGGEENVMITTDVPVRTQEQLEDSVTYVAEFNVIEETTPLSSNMTLQIDQLNRMLVDDDGVQTRRMFTGIINHIEGTSYPNEATVTCTGRLARLRLTRTADLDLTGMTDGEAVMEILDRCGISYDPDDIFDYGYQLGQIEKVVWQKGTPASQMIQELDRVFSMATIEIGTGRVVRIPYSRVPYDYSNSAIAAEFRRGDANTEFYENNRGRGDIEAIQNYWRVNGLSYQGAENTDAEGCNYTYFAVGQDAHAKLGAGVFIGPNEFSSDIIQSEALAKQIARRMMRWYNREPDTIRIVTLNNIFINVGDVVAVFDPAWGIDLTGTKRYLVLNISRDGDDMTIDGIGGSAGAAGEIHGGIEVCCGTQQDDGTCVDEGTDPSEGDVPDPGAPPDSPTGHCDPLTDTTCIPGEDYELPEEPDVDHPVICDGGNSDNLVDLINSPWRESGDIVWSYDAETNETLAVYTRQNGTLVYNITEPPTPKTTTNDFLFPGSEIVCISGTVEFVEKAPGVNAEVFIELFPAPDSMFGLWSSVRLFAENISSGYPTPGLFGLQAGSENQLGEYDPRAALHTCARDLVASSTNGGLSGSGLGYGAEGDFTVCFAPALHPQKIYYEGAWGSGYHEDISCPEHGLDEPPSCTHPHHILMIHLGHITDGSITVEPKVKLTNLSLGMGTCVQNPDWVNPYEDLEAP